jgi:hypothetical protein
MDQHVISEWLLQAFARRSPGGRLLEMFDKTTGRFETADPAVFMTEPDGHSREVEHGIERIETPASAAGRRLRKRTSTLPPGLYAVSPTKSATKAGGPPLRDEGMHEGARLLVSQHEIPFPNHEDRLALGRFAGLMYQRAPKLEASILRFGYEYDRFAQQALDQLLPGVRAGLATGLARSRSRVPGLATDIGTRLAESNWWILRPEASDAFVLGDSPVASTVSLGHDDEWRAIFSSETYLIAMPIGPTVAIMMAPMLIFPLSGIEPTIGGITGAVNRLMWRHADKAVLARERSHLESVWPEPDEARRFEGVSVPLDVEGIANRAFDEVTKIVVGVMVNQAWSRQTSQWQRWEGGHLLFGWPNATPRSARDVVLFGMAPDALRRT